MEIIELQWICFNDGRKKWELICKANPAERNPAFTRDSLRIATFFNGLNADSRSLKNANRSFKIDKEKWVRRRFSSSSLLL